MSKKLLTTLVVLLALLFVASCQAQETTDTGALESEIAALEAELEEAKDSGVSEEELDALQAELDAAIAAAEEAEEQVTITVWSHFANEPLFREVISGVFQDYEAAHPNVTIEVAWFDKAPLRDSIRTVMQAGGEGAPDMTTFDHEDVEWVEAGWLEPLDPVLDMENFVGGVDKAGSYPDLGYPGTYKFNMASMVDYILYNPTIFAELGIEVPDDHQFTQEEFLEVIQKCDDAGYDGFANAIGDRPYPGQYLPKAAILSLVGGDEFDLLWTGKTSWDTPEVRQALEYIVDVSEAGAWPASFSTMTLDEAHLYFHTQQNACMFFNGSWYSSRAFKPVEEGGQSPDFHFGLLKYPEMDGATAPDAMIAGFPTGYAVLSNSPHKDIALDILRFWSENPVYGARWSGITNLASAIKFSSEDVPDELKDNPWQWYWDTYTDAYSDVNWVVHGQPCGDFNDALVTVLNEGLPLGLFTVDEAIDYLDANLCTE